MKGSVYYNAPNYTPTGGTLVWKRISEIFFEHETKGGWVTFYVRFITHSLDPKTNRKWEIQANDSYISRDKKAYFNSADSAMLACERVLIPRIIEDIKGGKQ